MENLTAIQKLDLLLEYFIKMDTPPFKTDDEIFNELKPESTKEMFEIMHKLEREGYISTSILSIKGQDETVYGSTFDGRLFYLAGGYNAKSLADAADAEQQRLEINRLRSVDASNDQNQKTLNKLTNRLSWATWFAFGAAMALLIWSIYSYYHPAPIPINVKLNIEKSK